MSESVCAPDAGLPASTAYRSDLFERLASREGRSFTIDYSGNRYESVESLIKSDPHAKNYADGINFLRERYSHRGQGTNGAAPKQKASSLRRSLSDPFFNSWDFNNIDICAEVRSRSPKLIF
jgi:hypothetical protein